MSVLTSGYVEFTGMETELGTHVTPDVTTFLDVHIWSTFHTSDKGRYKA